jgi:hypothetical protein
MKGILLITQAYQDIHAKIVDIHVSVRWCNRIRPVMVSVLASNAVYRGLEPWSGQTKDYTIDICCFFAKYAALRRKSKD